MQQLVVTRETLTAAMTGAGAGEVADQVWSALAARPAASTSQAERPVDLQSVAWYGGGTVALVALVALSILLGTGWSDNGPAAGLAISLAYFGAFVALAEVFRRRRNRVPAGLMATVAVGVVPAVAYALLSLTLWPGGEPTSTPLDYPDFYTYISGGWVALEGALLVAAAAAWYRYRLSFILAPLMVAGWFASMDLADAVASGTVSDNLASAGVAAAFLAGGVALDRRGLRAEAFWLHLGGLLAGYYALASLDGDDIGTFMLVTGLLGGVALAVAVWLRRRVYLVFGAAWLFTALAYLAFEVFGGSLLFPLALAALGVAIVFAGVRLDRWRSPTGESEPVRPDLPAAS